MIQDIAAVDVVPVAEVPTKKDVSTTKTDEIKNQEKGPPPAAPQEIPEEIIKQVADEANSIVRPLSTSLSFSFDDKAGKNVIKIIDNDSGKLIRQIPPEEMLRLSEHMKELIGALVDKHV